MSDEIKLLPCPFCGCTHIREGRDDDGDFYHDCVRCLARTFGDASRERAIQDWNRRSAPVEAGTAAVDETVEALDTIEEALHDQNMASDAGNGELLASALNAVYDLRAALKRAAAGRDAVIEAATAQEARRAELVRHCNGASTGVWSSRPKYEAACDATEAAVRAMQSPPVTGEEAK
jgi:Lar family restriction alleviation protein